MTPFEERYSKLNADQKRAVDTIEGAVLVVAGPGSGKTEILALRVARILKETDVGPGGILCLTFTESAASNMRVRLASLIGSEAYRVTIGTFHSFAQQVAQQHPAYFRNGDDIAPAETIEQRELIAEAIRELPLRNPLAKQNQVGQLTFVSDVAKRISELKKAGITPEKFAAALAHNAELIPKIEAHLEELLPQTISKKVLGHYAAAADAIRNIPRKPFPISSFSDLATSLARSLDGALLDVEAGGKTTPLTDWKKKHTTKVGDKHILDARDNAEHMFALALTYKRYQELLGEKSLRDYEDLIVDLIEVLENNPDVRAELQEEYQYILVDEFQDTNEAQAQLIALLADNPATEGNPNLMVVGDDDQAIYRFHGAGLEHILGFSEKYKQATVVTMTTNYRSHQAILDLSHTHISEARERLVGRIPGLSKTLKQGGDQASSEIAVIKAESREEERDKVAELVSQKLEKGYAASEIAIIARRNKDLETIAAHLAERGIRVSYERQRNALEDAHIIELIELARCATLIGSANPEEADHLLPRVFAFPFWGINRIALWQLSRRAYLEKEPWIDVAQKSEVTEIKAVAELLIEIGVRCQDAPADQLLDELMGTSTTPEGRISPFRTYYFGSETRQNPERLLMLVSALRSVLVAFNESRRGEAAMLADFVHFADLRKEHEEPITTRINANENAVQLLTTHKAKGREFEVVIVLHATTDVWHGRGRADLISFPENLPLQSAKDTYDDQLRSMFVAITRAKRELYLAWSPPDTSSKSEPLALLEGLPELDITYTKKERTQLSWQAQVPPVTSEERDVLGPLVAEYQITPTQLNDFLDLQYAGPDYFFEKHILKFPQHQGSEMRFGNAMHAILEQLAIKAHNGEQLPKEDEIAVLVREALAIEHFHGTNLDKQTELGTRAIVAFCTQRADELKNATHVEVSFNKDHIMVGDARLTGKADVIREEEDGLVIIDYKTGTAQSGWDSKKAMQNLRYRRQLLFYAILAQQSPRFKGKEVKEAKLTFVVPDNSGEIHDLMIVPEKGEVDRVALLAQAVYSLVKQLKFPDITKYPKTLAGIEQFEQDILDEKV